MSGRDWSSIGAGPPLPRWFWWAVLPVAFPLAAIGWIGTHWDRIPLSYGEHGMSRTPLHVFGLPLFAAGLAALLLSGMLCAWYGSPRRGAGEPVAKIMLVVAYLVSALFTGLTVARLMRFPAWPMAAAIPLAALATIVYAMRAQAEPDDAPENAPAECWSLVGIYSNPQDPALFVRARMGYGYTLNMAHRWAYGFLVGVVGGVALLVGFLIWSQR